MNLCAIRYFVVKSSLTLYPLDNGMEPKDLFTFPIFSSKEVGYYKKVYTTRLINNNPDDRFLIGYLLKSTDLHLIRLDEKLFNEEDIQNWEKLFFVIDTERQIIAFENQSNIASPENVKNVLDLLTREPAKSQGYEVKLEFLVDKFAFWDLIKNSGGIYQIAFALNAPNLFGGRKKANEWLGELKKKHNMTKVAVDFRNERAALSYEAEELESYRDYADSGGGSWTLGILENGRKKRYKSEKHLRKEELDLNTDNPQMLRENTESIIRQLQEVLNRLDDLEHE
tara:strand:+ start:526 stop:1374 length:849 start_codon:yes stop_codon:yes gene_type:complete